MTQPADYVPVNTEAWTRANVEYTSRRAHELWAQEEITYGTWDAREADLGVLGNVHGKHVVELGCGTGYFGAWLKRAGAQRVVGVDVSPAQIETARAMNAEFGLGLEFLVENAERTSLPDAAFDLVVSDYGASLLCDPASWLAEAARLLRPGGDLLFLRPSTVQVLCASSDGRAGDRLSRPQRDLYRIDRGGDAPCTIFHPATSEMFKLLREHGFTLVDFRELYAPPGAPNHVYYQQVTAAWAANWPVDEVWRASKRP